MSVKTNPSVLRRKKRVLVVAPHPPFPLNQGGNIRLWALCRALSPRYDFSLAAFVPAPLAGDPKALQAMGLRLGALFRDVELAPAPPEFFGPLWTDFWRREIREHPAFLSLGERVQAMLRRNRFDLVHVEHAQMACCRRFIWGPPAVLTEHDAGWTRFSRSLAAQGNGSPWSWARRLWAYRRLCRAFQGVVTTSAADLSWWRRWGPAEVPSVAAPTGVDAGRFPFRPRAAVSGRVEVLFVGYFHHPPNRDAARWFLDRVWPRVLRRAPYSRVTFVGPHPPDWLLARAGDGVRVTGAVPDVRPFLAEAHVFVAPHRIGGGVKGKILEAMCAGVPVAATPWAMAGFEEEARRFVRLASGPEGFARGVLYLLKRNDARKTLSEGARRWAEKNRPWERSADILDRFYQSVMAGRKQVSA